MRSILTRLPTPPFYFRQALKGMSDSTTMPSSPFVPSHSPLLSSDWLKGRPARPKKKRGHELDGSGRNGVGNRERGGGDRTGLLFFWDPPHLSKSRRTSASPLVLPSSAMPCHPEVAWRRQTARLGANRRTHRKMKIDIDREGKGWW